MSIKKLALGVDLGGTHIGTCIINTRGKIFHKLHLNINKTEAPEKIIFDKLVPLIERTIKESHIPVKKLAGIGIGIPGNISTKTGVCVFSPNLRWKNISISKPVKKYFKIPVYINNDVSLAALGEKYFGAGKNCSDFICVTLGTGIGGGIIANNQLIEGAAFGAAEIGHITIDPNGPKCNCGSYGCMEAFASGPGIVKRTLRALKFSPQSVLKKINSNKITPLDIFHAAQKKDKLALKIWEETGFYLGIGLANCITILNPEKILIGGKIAQASKFFMPALKKEINKRIKMIPHNFTKIHKMKLGDSAGMIGAGCLVFIRQNYVT